MPERQAGPVITQIRTLFSIGSMGDLTDAELLQRFERHRAEAELAFEELVARHGPMVLDVCRRILRDPHDVNDAFQATFLVLVRRASAVRSRAAVGGWLHRVALRIALRAKADATRRRELESRARAEGTSEPPEDALERADASAALHEELDRIPASCRAAIVACHLEGLTHEEAASRLHWPVGTVRSRLARGRARLRDRLKRRGIAPAVALPSLGRPLPLVPASLKRGTAQILASEIAGGGAPLPVPSGAASLAKRAARAMSLSALRSAMALGIALGILALITMATGRYVRAWAAPVMLRAPGPSGRISGVVRDESGRPVEGATVVAGVFSEKANHVTATTGPDGRFALQPVGDGNRLGYAIAYKEGLAPASKFAQGSSSKAQGSELELVLLPSEPCVGVVQDRAGKPIAGASVRLSYMRGRGGKYDHNPILENVLKGTSVAPLFKVQTDSRGVFRFAAVPASGRVVLKASADGMADFSTEVPGDYEAGFVSGTAEKPVILTMEREARISGKLITKLPGLRLSGLKVALQSCNGSHQFWRAERTDGEGRFEMRALPAGGGNLFLVDHPSDGPWTYQAIDSLSLRPGKTAEVTIELIEGLLVEGAVEDGVTGEPVPELPIGMYGPARPESGAAIMSTKTDELGRFRFRLPSGKTRFYVTNMRDWTAPFPQIDIPEGVTQFTLPTLKATKRLPKPAAPAPATGENIPGQVQADERTSFRVSGVVREISDDPVPGATVVGAVVAQDDVRHRRVVETDSDGRFALTMTNPHDATAVLRIYAYRPGLAPAIASVELSDTPPAEAVTLLLAPPRPFEGVVLDGQENPVVGADVRVQAIKAPVLDGSGVAIADVIWPAVAQTPLESVFRATTDASGAFRLPSMPERSVLNLVAASKGMRTHRTSDFMLPEMTGRWPEGFNQGFLNGSPDAPARIFLDPERNVER